MDYFNKVFVWDVFEEKFDFISEGVLVVDVVFDCVFGGFDISLSVQWSVGCVFEQVEDWEDVIVVCVVEKEI